MFESIVGQENAKKTIRSMMESGRIPHTLLFAGPSGVGKGEMAFEVARMLLCENGLDSGCTTCGACVRASKIEHPDLHVLYPFRAQPLPAKEYNGWIDSLSGHRKRLAAEPYAPIVYEKGRQIVVGLVGEVRDRLLESSFEGGRKVCVILLAERLNPKTGNTLLKILEEPPDGVHFILTTERLSSVLPTIVSRASIVRFRRLYDREIEDYLEKAGVVDPGERRSFALAGEGSLKAAKSFAFSDIISVYGRAGDMYAAVAAGNYDTVVSCAYPYLKLRDQLEAEELVYGFIHCTRDVLNVKIGQNPRTGNHADVIGSLSDATDIASLERLSGGLEKGLDMLGRNVNVSMVITTLLYEIHDAYRTRQYR